MSEARMIETALDLQRIAVALLDIGEWYEREAAKGASVIQLESAKAQFAWFTRRAESLLATL